ncbi:MRC [Mytilus coruscus]|uniref:MRC n=1 Tax=Mytilus coruscus TaxID=42192 RepID=A0A6J8CST9_MYTCO|nr:MRC [Mytilus coruscus]
MRGWTAFEEGGRWGREVAEGGGRWEEGAGGGRQKIGGREKKILKVGGGRYVAGGGRRLPESRPFSSSVTYTELDLPQDVYLLLSNKITEEWQNVAIYNDKDFTVYILWTVPGKSASVCGNICARESRCLSFTWNKFGLRCKMFSKIFYTNALSTSMGNIYFKRKDFCTSEGYTETPTLPELPVCFRFFQLTPLDAVSASSECQKYSATLLRILNLDTIMYIAEHLRNINAGTDVLIDGTDIVVKYDWKYSDGSDVTYIKWAPGEPSSVLCFWCEERCLVLQNKIPFNVIYFEGMNNMKCGDARPYICQLHIYA